MTPSSSSTKNFSNKCGKKPRPDSGFSIVELAVAMTVFLIVMLAMSAVFVYCVNYNAGNNTRTEALLLLRQELERLRNAKFTSLETSAALAGGIQPDRTITNQHGATFSISTTVDDDPFADGVQTDTSHSLKEITVTVRLERPTPGWQTALPATSIVRRARSH